jgi:hypothetical protein
MLFFVVSLVGLVGSASAALCVPVDSCPKLSDALYCPVNNVTEHGDINRDVAQISTLLKESPPNYAQAKTVYTNGMYSTKGANMRTLRALAQKDMTVNGKYTNAWYSGSLDLHGSINGIWDDYMMACLDNTGFCAGKSDDFKKYIINKCAIGIVMGYTTYEMGAAVWKAADGSLTDAGAPYAWDEAAAFFIGNKAPALGDGYTGSAPGNLYSPYEFAWKRDKDFPDGLMAHTRSVPVLNYGLLNIRSYNAANLLLAQDAMYDIIAITAIRSAIKYAQKAAKGGSNSGYSDKYHAEGWAYWRSGSGYIASVSAAAKAKVQEIDILFDLSLTTLPASMPCDVKTKVESLYSLIGLSCELVGTWKDHATTGCSACSAPGTSSNAVIAGSTAYVDMCKVPVITTTTTAAPESSAGVMSSMPTIAATFAAAAATCDFA